MDLQKNNYDLIKFVDGEFSLDVNVSPKEDTVWLSANQIAKLYCRERSVISKHIKKIFLEKECLEESNVQKMHIANSDKPIELFSLDVILSVGYRVKSPRGILFRKWATSILKQYMLNGYSIHEKRCLECQENLVSLNNKVNILVEHDLNHTQSIKKLSNLDTLLKDKLFYENQIFDAYSYIKQLFLSAKSSIILIDGYIDISVLDMLKEVKVPITIYTYPNAQLSNQDITKFSIGHRVEIYRTSLIHDRFIIIDSMIYSIGASIKDAGKKRFVMTKLESISTNDLVKKL